MALPFSQFSFVSFRCGTCGCPLGLRLRAADPLSCGMAPPGAVLGSTRAGTVGAAEPPGALRGATVGATGRPGAPVWGHWAFNLSMRDNSTAEGLRQFVMSFLMISACISGLSAWHEAQCEQKADEWYRV